MNTGQGLQSLIPPKSKRFESSKNIPKKVARLSFDDEKLSHATFFVDINKIIKNPHQPRKYFNKTKLKELADSIKEHGILQPLVITNAEKNNYQLIAGERRFQAAKIVGLDKVPVVIRNSSDKENLELALVENVQRDNLNSIEKAYAFKKLADKFNLIQEDIAKRIGKSRESVTNTLRLLALPAEIQRAILENKITEGHGRAILSLSDIEKQLSFFKEILKKKLSVRQAEAMSKKINKSVEIKPKSKQDPHLRDLEDKLSNILGTRVKLTRRGKKGKIIIEFFSQEELNSIIKKICGK